MKITIDEVLIKRDRSRYWLAGEIDMRYHNLTKICNGKTSSIKFDVLERICKALDCSPSDVIHFD